MLPRFLTWSIGIASRRRGKAYRRNKNRGRFAKQQRNNAAGKVFAAVTEPGFMVRDARRCRAPHHEGLRRADPETNLILRSAYFTRVSKDEVFCADFSAPLDLGDLVGLG